MPPAGTCAGIANLSLLLVTTQITKGSGRFGAVFGAVMTMQGFGASLSNAIAGGSPSSFKGCPPLNR